MAPQLRAMKGLASVSIFALSSSCLIISCRSTMIYPSVSSRMFPRAGAEWEVTYMGGELKVDGAPERTASFKLDICYS